MTKEQIRAVLDRVLTGPPERQEEVAKVILEIEAELRLQVYHVAPDELQALDEAELSGTASDREVEAAFRAFNRP
jgi:hypothetical protein